MTTTSAQSIAGPLPLSAAQLAAAANRAPAAQAANPQDALQMAQAAAMAGHALNDSQRRPLPGMSQVDIHPEWRLLSRMPLRLTASIPLPSFKVRDLLALTEGQLLSSSWSSTADVPLRVGSVQLCWSEFEVVEQRMAVRVSRLA